MSIAVKICGMTSLEAVDAAIAAGADYGGLVFGESPRKLGIGAAGPLASRMRGKLKIVALVVNEGDDMLARIAQTVRPDFFQLHGSEPPSRAADIRSKFGVPVIKALALAEPSDLDGVAEYEAVSDMLLFDARAPAGADRAGGHGAAFDWKILAGRTFAKPWFLAGGLDPDNVARALSVSGAAMADVSSGVESAPGVKDIARIKAFVAAAKALVRA